MTLQAQSRASASCSRFITLISAMSCAYLLALATSAAHCAENDALDGYLFPNGATSDPIALPTAPQSYWLQDPELRITEDKDELAINVQTYRLRFHPTSGIERATTRALFTTENTLTTLQWEKAQSAALANRYHRLVDLAEQEAKLVLAQQQSALDGRVLAAERALSAGSRYSATRLQNAIVRGEQHARECQQVLDRVNALRTATVGAVLAVATDGPQADVPQLSKLLIRPSAVTTVLASIATQGTSVGFANQLAQLEVQRAQHEETLAKDENRFGFSLLELSHQSQRIDSYAVTVGFRLPFFRHAYDSQRRAREVTEARQHALLTEQTSSAQLQDRVRELTLMLKSHAVDNTALEEVGRRITATRKTSAASDASILANLRQYQLDLSASAMSLHSKALHEFVTLLDAQGLLQQQNRNWLSTAAANSLGTAGHP